MTLYERDQRNIEKGKEAGRAEGEAIGRALQTADTIRQARKRGKTISAIADFLGMTEEDIRKFCSENEITI